MTEIFNSFDQLTDYAEFQFPGTHNGDFMGIPATGKPIRVTYSDIWRIEDGKGVENWVQMDMLGVMQQLGVAPSQ